MCVYSIHYAVDETPFRVVSNQLVVVVLPTYLLASRPIRQVNQLNCLDCLGYGAISPFHYVRTVFPIYLTTLPIYLPSPATGTSKTRCSGFQAQMVLGKVPVSIGFGLLKRYIPTNLGQG